MYRVHGEKIGWYSDTVFMLLILFILLYAVDETVNPVLAVAW